MKIPIETATVDLVLEALTGNWRTEEEMNAFHDKQMQAIAAMLAVLAKKPPMASMENT